MTHRQYYDDSYTHHFEAQIIERLTWRDQPALILDKTYFYPTSGGQPHDRGTIADIAVVAVVVRESDQAIIHILQAEPPTETLISGHIDWVRRFDHMQQHTGQHILSQAFIRVAAAETVGFHLGEKTVSIDLNIKRLPPDALTQAEAMVNDVVLANLPVRAWFPTPDELAGLPLRKTPEVMGKLRVVAIGEFDNGIYDVSGIYDATACGGTHVRHTGELGLIKILKQDKRSGGLQRIEFRCGRRAIADYHLKHQLVSQLANDFSCGYWEVDQAVSKLRGDFKAARRDLKQARNALAGVEAAQMLTAAQPDPQTGWHIICKAWDARDAGELRQMATRLSQTPDIIALLGTAGPRAHLVFACADNVDADMRPLLKQALAGLNSERGGGSAKLAQGGGVEADLALVEQALARAQTELASTTT